MPIQFCLIEVTWTIKEITVYCLFYPVNKSNGLKKETVIVEWLLSIQVDIMLRYLLICEILVVFIFGVFMVKSANSLK